MKLISSPVEALIKPVRSVAGIVERNQSLPVVSNILIEQKVLTLHFRRLTSIFKSERVHLWVWRAAKETSPSTHKSFLKSSELFAH